VTECWPEVVESGFSELNGSAGIYGADAFVNQTALSGRCQAWEHLRGQEFSERCADINLIEFALAELEGRRK